MNIRSLAGVSWNALATAFNEAFSDYIVPASVTPQGLSNMQLRRGYAPEVSFGAYEGERLVGFVFTCLDGDRAYNSGTGVTPAYRRGGVARQLLEAVLASAPAKRYVLEVIEGNERAIAFYRKHGFAETRRFACFTYESPSAPPATELPDPDLDVIAADADVELSWQNSVASIRRAPEPHVVLADEGGAAVVFPGSADLALLVVRRDARRRRHGTRLLQAAAARCGRSMRILNVDTRAAGIAAFLQAAGAKPLVRQLEMEREIG